MIARLPLPATLLAATLLLGGCDLEALLADPKMVQKIADAKAIGGACRHGNRSIEDCYALNEKFPKASIYDGWRDMDQYMRDNKLDGMPAVVPKPVVKAAAEEEEDPPEPPPKSKSTAKH